MGSAQTSTPCGICGSEARGPALPTLFGHATHKKCKDRFVLNRELAWVIDFVVLIIAPRSITTFLLARSMRVEDVADSDELLIVSLACLVVFLLKDSIRGISLGKLVTGLQAIDTRTGEPIGPLQSVQRNLITLIPLAPIVLAFQMRKGPRFGEGWAHTRVVDRARRNQLAFGGNAPHSGEDWSSSSAAR